MSLAPKKTYWNLPSSAQLPLRLRWKATESQTTGIALLLLAGYMMGRMEVNQTELRECLWERTLPFLEHRRDKVLMDEFVESMTQVAPDWWSLG